MNRSSEPLQLWTSGAALACLIWAGAAAAQEGAVLAVDPGNAAAADTNPGTPDKPLKTLEHALSLAKGGETIELGAGTYPALAISAKFPQPVTIKARQGQAPILGGGVDLSSASNVRLQQLKLTWAPGTEGLGSFISIKDSSQIQVLDCEIFDDAAKTLFRGVAVSIRKCEGVTLQGGHYHHVYQGVSLSGSRQTVMRGIQIRTWNHEDGVQFTDCDGVLIENCHITQADSQGKERSGHVDGIQLFYGATNVTIRNNHLHNLPQGIGIFTDDYGKKWTTPRRNFRIEGNLIYDIGVPNALTLNAAENPVLINNTLPQGTINLGPTTIGAVVKNNIFRGCNAKGETIRESDYNLWMEKPKDGYKLGAHELVGVDPGFVNAPPIFFTTPWGKEKEMTRTRFLLGGTGKVEVGDFVEITNMDEKIFLIRDGIARQVTKVEGNNFEVDPPLPSDPGKPNLLISNWKKNNKNLVPDFHLKSDSPAVDSGDGTVDRGADMDGHPVFDAPEAPNNGPKGPACDRGAFEYTPAAK